MPTRARAIQEPLLTFVSMPDFLNADVASTTSLPRWQPGDPTSTNKWWREAIGAVLDAVQSHDPDLVLVAGDLVHGEWHKDEERVRLFGSIRGLQRKRLAIHRAGALYYGRWKRRFAARDLPVHPTLGDHEIGDNPWLPGKAKTKLVRTFKNTWARAFTDRAEYGMHPTGTAYDRTAYAFTVQNTLFVGVDVFRARKNGVEITVRGGQLRWLRDLLERARLDPRIAHVVVQGHTPVLGPVRGDHTSGLTMAGGSSSEFWSTLKTLGADLYLAGEFHAITSINDGPIEQLVHGGNVGKGSYHSFVVGKVYPDRIELTAYEAPLYHYLRKRTLWNTTSNGPAAIVVVGLYEPVGTLTRIEVAGHTEWQDRTGVFMPYQP